MKKIVLVCALLLLTACEAVPPTNTESPTNSSTSSSTSTSTTPVLSPTDKATQPSANVKTETIIDQKPSFSIYDQTAYDGAIKLKDVSYCQKISNVDLKNDCLNTIQTPVAESSNPTTVNCDTITNPDKKAVCDLNKQIAVETAQKEQQQAATMKSEEKTVAAAEAALDMNQCNSITTASLKQECQVNVILQKSQKDKNPALCDQLDSIDASAKDICLKGALN